MPRKFTVVLKKEVFVVIIASPIGRSLKPRRALARSLPVTELTIPAQAARGHTSHRLQILIAV